MDCPHAIDHIVAAERLLLEEHVDAPLEARQSLRVRTLYESLTSCASTRPT